MKLWALQAEPGGNFYRSELPAAGEGEGATLFLGKSISVEYLNDGKKSKVKY